MRKLLKPAADAGEVFVNCSSIVRDDALKVRLLSVAPNVVAAAAEYSAAAEAAALHNLQPQADVGGVVSRKEMSDVYEYRMVKSGTPGREVYDKLLSAPVHGRCPLCGQGIVSTLDHHLAKTHFPALAVAPENLVPACSDCNKVKLSAFPAVAHEQTLHPYFDDFDHEQWLFANVIEGASRAVRFYVKAPASYGALMAQRIAFNFDLFKLSSKYASYSAEELTGIRFYLDMIFSEAGGVGVRNHLTMQAQTHRAVHVNSWQTSMYQALSESDWFCEGGFQEM